ncbi:hypothetical protein [Nocardioides yefusunii]|uniref:PadR family transcriptional regulator n=1 Tax=Nocardioides yefusunii TaxID=2500546 RepID=A0ABW1QZX9_9ACTN|nr:hypothetical protein [Nocardioides yefusunii]
MTQHLTDIHLQVLVFMSLLGEATEYDVAHVSDLPAEDCEAEFLDLAATGLAKWGGGSAGWRITDLGRAEHAKRVRRELDALEHDEPGTEALVRATLDAVTRAGGDSGDDQAAVLAATDALVARMRRFGAYSRRLAAAARGEGDEKWADVRDMLVTDLELTLG